MAKIIDLSWVQDEAEKLFVDHGLHGWSFRWDNAKLRFGACHFGHNYISISRPLAMVNGENEIRETLLHEVAHAIAGPMHDHDRVWQDIAISLGASPARCYDPNVVTEVGDHKYEAHCGECGYISKRYRWSHKMNVKYCGSCVSQYGFLPQFKLNYIEVR